MPPGTNSSLVEIKTRSHFFTSGGSSQYRKAQSSVLRNWFLVRLEIWQKWNFNLCHHNHPPLRYHKYDSHWTIFPSCNDGDERDQQQYWYLTRTQVFPSINEFCSILNNVYVFECLWRMFFVNYTWTQVFFLFFFNELCLCEYIIPNNWIVL